MGVTVGVGLQYGDEGKIKVFDRVVNVDVWARYNGGNNAGHNLEAEGKHVVTHGIPSGIFHPDSFLYIGSGCVVNPGKLNAEIAMLVEQGVRVVERLYISPYVTLIQPAHLLLDQQMGKSVGTTGNGIGPAYADQAFRQLGKRRKNIRLCDYLADPDLKDHVFGNLVDFSHPLAELYSSDVNVFDQEVRKLAGYVVKDPLWLEKMARQGKNIFLEGANGVMLDMVTGEVPFVTSSRTLASAAYTGADLSLRHHQKVIGVAKAIPSRVGHGPFVAEFGGKRSEDYTMEEGGRKYTKDVEGQCDAWALLRSDDLFEIGKGLRILGNEYGATTGRPRRLGMLDLVMLRDTCMANGVDELYLNKVDTLQLFSHTCLRGIPLVTAYNPGQWTFMPPTGREDLQPDVQYSPHILDDISAVRRFKDLPWQAKELVERVEQFVGVEVKGIGVGPKREQFIETGRDVR